MMQYYRISDWKEYPVETAAIYACGLPTESRVVRALTNQKIGIDTMLNAIIADRLTQLVWFKTKDGRKHRNKPKSLVKMLTSDKTTKTSEQTFKSGEDFEEARRRIIEGM